MPDKDKINNKFHAQKYYTLPNIDIFKKSEDNLQKPQQSITGTKRSNDFHTTENSDESSKGLNQNDSNKKLKNSEESDQNVSTPEVDLVETSDDSRPTSSNSKGKIVDTSHERGSQSKVQKTSESSLRPAPIRSKSKGKIVNTSQHERESQSKVRKTSEPSPQPALIRSKSGRIVNTSQHERESQSKVQKISESSPDSPDNTKIWTHSQTREQQLEIMKYWLDQYQNQNRFDPTISDLASGKPWNEIEGKLLSRFMPVFKRYLLDHGLCFRITEFYFLFFTALRDKHKTANKIPDDV